VLRLIYLMAVATGMGAAAGAMFGNWPFWLAVGSALGLAWHHVAPDDGDDHILRYAALSAYRHSLIWCDGIFGRERKHLVS
jgi:hypothetical protein